MTLADIPGDIFADACGHVRRTVDHPSRIVPAIIAFSDPLIAERERRLRLAQAESNPARILPAPEMVTYSEEHCRDMAAKLDGLLAMLKGQSE